MRDVPALIRHLRRGACRLGLPGTRLLLAVSGGPDSVAMMAAFRELAAELALDLRVATIDHGLREGSSADAAFVRRLARRLGLPCEVRKVDVGREGGTEAAARKARYAALEDLAQQTGCGRIATGHTLEDQAETVLLRLARGTGTRGLRGILRRRGRVVRPMLDAPRAAVRSYLASRRLVAREDPTNRRGDFDRNRVRAEVLPALVRALGPAAIRALARAADVAAEDERWLEAQARDRAREALAIEGRVVQGAVEALAGLPPALRRRVLRQAARAAGVRLGAAHVERIEAALGEGRPRRVGLPGGVEWTSAYGRFRLGRPAPNGPAVSEHPIAGPGLHRAGRWRVEVAEVCGPGREKDGAIRLDPAQVRLPLWIRPRRDGDRFRPAGGHEKKLKAFLIDRKVPRGERDRLPLLCDDSGRVLWVVGLRASDAAEEGRKAKRAWEIDVGASDPPGRALGRGEGGRKGREKGVSPKGRRAK